MQTVTRSWEEFTDNYSPSLLEVGTQRVQVLYDPAIQTERTQQIQHRCDVILAGSEKFKRYQAQIDRVVANVLAYQQQYHGVIDSLAPRCGKTPIALLTADALNQYDPRFPRRVLVVCPPHLVPQWLDDIQALFGNKAQGYDLNQSVSYSKFNNKYESLLKRYQKQLSGKAAEQTAYADALKWAYAKDGFRQLTKLRDLPRPAKLEFYVIGLVKFRQAPRWRPIHPKTYDLEWYVQKSKDLAARVMRGELERWKTAISYRSLAWLNAEADDEDRKEIETALQARLFEQHCPDCGNSLVDKRGFPVLLGNSRKLTCPYCRAALYQPEQQEQMWYSANVAEYVANYLPDTFGLVVFDEAHKIFNGESGQGTAGKKICRVADRVLFLTGTPSDGMSSKLWDMAWNLTPGRMKTLGFNYRKRQRFIEQYGVLEEITAVPIKDGVVTNGKVTHRVKEQPGIAGRFMTEFALRYSVFGQLMEFFQDLPPYTEEVRVLPMGEAMQTEYNQFAERLREMVRKELRAGCKRRLWMLMLPLMDCCENAFHGRNVFDEGDLVARYAALGDAIQPKERDLIEFVRESVFDDRQQVCVYAENTDTINIVERLKTLLETELQVRVKTLTGADNTQTRNARIKKWMEQERYDVFIVNPKRVEVGMSLPWATRVYFYQLSLSTSILRQAAQRGRGEYQKVPVKVVFALYDGTMQTRQLWRQAKKLKHAQLFDGMMPSGLAEADDEHDSLLEALAKDFIGESEAVEADVRKEWAALRELEVTQEEKAKDQKVEQVIVLEETHEIKHIGEQELDVTFTEMVLPVIPDDAPVGTQGGLFFGMKKQVTVKTSQRKPKVAVNQLSLFG